MKIQIEIEAQARYCGKCEIEDMGWCGAFMTCVDYDEGANESVRCQACLDAEVFSPSCYNITDRWGIKYD
jgi:hypothetical protein